MAYRNNLQADALKLVAKKLQPSLAVEGRSHLQLRREVRQLLPLSGFDRCGWGELVRLHITLGVAVLKHATGPVGATANAAYCRCQ